MKIRLLASFAASLFAACLLVTHNAAAQTETIRTVQLLDMVAEAKGKVIMINFFASWCPPCQAEIPGLISIRKEFSEDDFLIIGVSVDEDSTAMNDFIAETGFNYPVYHGDPEISFAYQVSSIPHNVIYNKDGKKLMSRPGFISEEDLSAILHDQLGIQQD